MVCVVGRMRDLILQLSKSSIYSTKPKFNNIEELKTALSDYIHYYNNQRISIKLKGLSPVEYRLKVCSHPVRT
ncbi:IS3 family transposase [Klebsiella quasipneumoniae]|uniref:IS3 family transposase n=1 Tax=Klebsiella quasipneumoniae TaxID=1463165 RepID=UPI0034D25144